MEKTRTKEDILFYLNNALEEGEILIHLGKDIYGDLCLFQCLKVKG